MHTLLIALLVSAVQAAHFPAQIAPFTDATLPSAERLTGPTGVPAAAGCVGQGIAPREAMKLDGLKLNPVEGIIEVWVKPTWAGNDGKRHRLWATQQAGGRQLILEKSELGFLRAEMRTPSGPTDSRADVSDWKPGIWHHVAVGWVSNKGVQVGLPLWIDKVAVDGPVTPHGVFDGTSLPQSLVLGDASSDAVFDELIVRPDLNAEGRYGMVACVYRDYFRTAPYDAIRIEPDSTRVPSDKRAVAGYEKRLGLSARRQGVWEPVTENVVRYSQWAYFDAKPFISWMSSDGAVATAHSEGKISPHTSGKTTITAEFHGLKASYPLTVLSPNKPDLDAICIELLPRYRNDAVKDRPTPGEMVTARVRIGNYGLATLARGAAVRLALVPHRPHNYSLNPAMKPAAVMNATIDTALAPGAETAVEFKFPFPAESTWMKLDIDPDNKIDEQCKANNTITELTDARPVHYGYDPKVLKACLDEKRINHVGSFCYYDWIRAEKLRMDVMLHDAVWPTTGPNGVEEAYRIDAMTALEPGRPETSQWNKEEAYFDGGFPVDEPVDLMAIDCAIIHEFGHTILSQPDLYGYPQAAYNVFLTDDAGKPIAGTPEMPIVNGDATLARSPGINVPCDVGYPWLMDGCQLWLPPSQAGHVMYYKGYRPDRFWGTQGRLIPTRANWLLLTDANDRPLKGAAVYVYHVSQAPVQDSGEKYFADRPKFMGNTGDEGRYIFPNETDKDWDDPETDDVDGTKPVWNPFGTVESETAFTPNVWEVEGLLLLKIVSGGQTEYQFMDLTQFNTEFLSGHFVCGKYPVRTSLSSSPSPTPLVRKPVPEAIRKVNKRPVAVAPKELTVKCGAEFEIDGSKSFDPEGQPLIYRWNTGGQWLAGTLTQAPVLKMKAPIEPKELEYRFWVLDGVRCSEAVEIKVKVEK